MRQIVQANVLGMTTGDQIFAIGRIRDGVEVVDFRILLWPKVVALSVASAEHIHSDIHALHLFAMPRLINLQLAIQRTTAHLLAIKAVIHVQNLRVGVHHLRSRCVVNIPKTNGFIPRARNQNIALTRKRQTRDRRLVSIQDIEAFAAAQRPHIDFKGIFAASHDEFGSLVNRQRYKPRGLQSNARVQFAFNQLLSLRFAAIAVCASCSVELDILQ
mmetsp:Transcript_24598/g.38970  ORF Transcript_24598/g.38970 Transcript_24598/m.38970 type:complete len:216 (-) Transcript_24598:487-1134(-)